MTRTPDPGTFAPTRWRALAVILVATFMVLLDTSIVNNAVPSIQRDLGASTGQVQFVLNTYLLAYAALLITGGRLGDTLGRKRVFLWGVGGFAFTSALCGLAASPEFLILCRTLQGLTAALLVPQVSAIIQVSFPHGERGKAFGFFGAVVGLGTVAGPLLGGLLIGADLWGLGWRPIFLINVPVGLVALFGTLKLVTESRSEAVRNLDLGSAALLALTLLLFVYPVIEGRGLGWPLWVVACFPAALLTLGLFALYGHLKANRGGTPLVEPTLFRSRAFTVGVTINLVFFSGVYSLFLALSIFLQSGLGLTALQAALTIVPFQATSLVASLLSARITKRFGRGVLYLGGALLVVGVSAVVGILANSASLLGPGSMFALVTCGAGFGFIIGPLTTLVLAGVLGRAAGSAAGVLATAQQVGGAVGVAVVGALLFGPLGSDADRAADTVIPKLEAQLLAERLPEAKIAAVVQAFRACFSDRAESGDPGAGPTSCEENVPAVSTGVQGFTAEASRIGWATNFSHALRRALRYNLAVFAITLGLFFFLPAAGVTTGPGPKGGADAGERAVGAHTLPKVRDEAVSEA